MGTERQEERRNDGGASGEQMRERILVLAEAGQELDQIVQILHQQFAAVSIDAALSLSELRERIHSSVYEVVILPDYFAGVSGIELMRELRALEHDPAVLMLAASSEPAVITAIYDAGTHKCVAKTGNWLAELSPSIRQLFRLKRLEEQNLRLLARLTESNIMLEDKNRRLDEFSATLAHDIRGPLGGVSMKLDYIIDRYQDELPERATELIGKAVDSVGRLTKVIQAMYEYAKLGKEAAQMEEANLAIIVPEVIHDLHFDESLDINIGIDSLPIVWGSTELLRRVFINLITNAVKYSDKKQIIINIGLERIVERSLANFAEIFIEDNGPGIPEADHEAVFSMFTRGATADGIKDGMGLGLSVVQRIMELHYGKIRLISEPGKGCKFVLSLPIEKIDFIG